MYIYIYIYIYMYSSVGQGGACPDRPAEGVGASCGGTSLEYNMILLLLLLLLLSLLANKYYVLQ